jgi:PilZ domain
MPGATGKKHGIGVVSRKAKMYLRRPAPLFAFAMADRSIHYRLVIRISPMQTNSQERRMMRRFDMRLPVRVRFKNDRFKDGQLEGRQFAGANEFHTETQNVSARGVFFYLDRAVEAGTKLEVTLTFPPHITLTDAVRVRFNARVVRIENPLPSFRIGVAAMIEGYEFLRSTDIPDFTSTLRNGIDAAN